MLIKYQYSVRIIIPVFYFTPVFSCSSVVMSSVVMSSVVMSSVVMSSVVMSSVVIYRTASVVTSFYSSVYKTLILCGLKTPIIACWSALQLYFAITVNSDGVLSIA